MIKEKITYKQDGILKNGKLLFLRNGFRKINVRVASGKSVGCPWTEEEQTEEFTIATVATEENKIIEIDLESIEEILVKKEEIKNELD